MSFQWSKETEYSVKSIYHCIMRKVCVCVCVCVVGVLLFYDGG